ncbi:E3 ubiquitin-protein ligase TRIM7-like [Heteronotia binoei]|uniref:E3 ubiquitin-protein ligase TRIM7-like n=1 Tax=Heteronotia binoei TaxID=13085 RepID=UPI0029307DE9|nr:E3 ubiquitin-protein ligase TRIM7-like [Heteronotia binoei]
MAAGGPVQQLCQEATCSICLDFFRDPVILECGHNFCLACLTHSWEEEGGAEPSCPQCRRRAQKRKFWPNQQVANFVEIAKKFKPLAGKGAEVKGGVCEKHQEPQKFYCKEDEAPICMFFSLAEEHQHHKVVLLEETFQENRDPFCSCMEILKKEIERIVAYREDAEKESQDLLEQTIGEKQKALAKFRQLHTFLEEKEKLLLAQMEEVEKEVARNRDQHLVRLSEELSFLESLKWVMEEKSHQPASELLQDVRSTLQRYEEKERPENPVTFPLALKWRILDLRDINLLLEVVMKQLKDNLDSGLHLQKANVTLDPDTAHPDLILSEDRKSVREGEKPQALPNNPERFVWSCIVLGREGFTSGRHFWEVLVGSEDSWSVGVARKSVRRKGVFSFSPEAGFWEVGKWGGKYKASIKDHYPPLTLSGELKRIRVCLNYNVGRVAFFDADRAALLYEFSGASFCRDTLLPSFWVRLEGHLQLC